MAAVTAFCVVKGEMGGVGRGGGVGRRGRVGRGGGVGGRIRGVLGGREGGPWGVVGKGSSCRAVSAVVAAVEAAAGLISGRRYCAASIFTGT